MKCLYCGKRLALLRKLTDSEFCSDAHRKAYQNEHERMALERLMDAQKRFSAFTGAGTGAVHSEKPVTRRGSKAEAAPSPSPATVGEELKGFLPLEPAERQLKNFWRFRPEIIPQMPEVIVPERQLQLDAFPRQGMIAALERLEAQMRAPAANRVVVEPGVAPSGMGPELPQLKRPITQRGANGGASRGVVRQQAAAVGVVVEPERRKDRLPVMRKQAEALTRAAWTQPAAANDLLPALWEPLHLARLQQGMEPATVQAGEQRLREPAPAPVAALPGQIQGPRSQMRNPLLAAGNAQVLSNSARPQDRSAGQRGGLLHLLEFRGKPWLRQPGAILRLIDAAVFSPSGTEQTGDCSEGVPPRAGLAPIDGLRQTPVLNHSCKPGLVEMCEAGQLAEAGASPVFSTWAAHGRRQFTILRTSAWAVPAAAVDFGFQALAATGTSLRVELYAAVESSLGYARPRLQVTAGATGLRIVQSADGPGEPLATPLPVPAASGAVRTRTDWLEADGRARTAARRPSSGSGIGGPAGLRSEPLCPLAEPVSEDSGTTAMKPVDAGAPTAGVVPMQLVGARQEVRNVVAPSEPRSAATLFALDTVAVAGPESQRMRAAAEDPAPLATPETEAAPATRLDPQYPVYRVPVSGDCAPEASACIFPNPARPSEPVQPARTIAIQELAALWPDSHALKPRLRASIAEDEDLRDAVRAIREALGSGPSRFIPNLRMPQVSFQFSRPDWKWSVMLVPVLLLLAVYAITNQQRRPGIGTAESLASAGVAAPAEGGETAQARASTPEAAGFLNTMQQSIERRAAISFSDDFRSGLADWEGNGEWSRSWSYDAAGFLRTGPLALYRPSLALTDYRMEFLGQIARKSIGWVYRARDSKNYYATKITLVRGGPLPTAVIDRYAVVNGRESRRVQVPLPLSVREDTLYRVRMDVRGDGFTLTVQGQVVDHWSDDRIKDGGVGFFSAKGEQARLRWVEISHQSDFLGKLCAFLAPYNLPSKDGSLR